MNATDLFELANKDQGIRPNSESFWSALFCFYLLHLSASSKSLTTWHCTNKEHNEPYWFKRLPDYAWLCVEGLTIKDIAVEPSGFDGIWTRSAVDKTPYFTGISPDIVFKAKDRFVVIENKVRASADLNSNQRTSYRDLIKQLAKDDINCRLLLLLSVGADKIYESALKLQEDFKDFSLADHFAVILWEDVIRSMKRDGFSIAGLDIDSWQSYTTAGMADCRDWGRGY